jgi:hypothetical protein
MRLVNKQIFASVLKWLWLLLGLMTLILRFFTPPQYIEQFYSRGVFLGVRWVFDHSLAFSPFPLLLVFYGLCAYFVFKFCRFLFSKKMPLSLRFTEGGRRLLNFAGFMIFWFNLFWGFHYNRIGFAKQMNLTVPKMDTAQLRQELQIASQEAIQYREKWTNQAISEQNRGLENSAKYLEATIRHDLIQYLNNHHFPASGILRGREIRPLGFLFRFGISGIYMPYIGESNIDAALHPLEKPFTMAHEMAHGFGWTDEATANFIAYLCCRASRDLFVNYSGAISYYRYVASNYRRLNPEAYQLFRAQLPEGFRNDLEAIYRRQQAYPTWFETTGLNDVFLKSQGVKEGVESYARIVLLVRAWRQNPF